VRVCPAFLLTLLLITVCTAENAQDRAARELIVKWRSLPTRLDASYVLPTEAGSIEDVHFALPQASPDYGLNRITVVRTCNTQVAEQLVETLQHDPRIEYVERRPVRSLDVMHNGNRRNGRSSLDGVPNDPYYSRQWDLPAIEAEAAWNITRGDPSVIIAVVDLGVDFTHPELANARWVNQTELHGLPGIDDDGNGYTDDVYGYDFIDNDGDPAPSPLIGNEAHGTHVAGIACAARNNGIGIAGLAPACKIMGVRAGSDGSISFGYDGIYYACRSGANIINCSWGGDGESAYENDILQYATDHDCIIVASAGNTPLDLRHYPAAREGVVSVAATQINDFNADFTTFGSWVKIAAPGVEMLSTVCEDTGRHGYASWQGTSMSAPLVAAACALVKSRWPQMRAHDVITRVLSSADPIDARNPSRAGLLGLGRINVWRALADSIAGVRLGDITYTERMGNGDGRIRAGETATLHVGIFNDGADAGQVVGLMSTTATNVTIAIPALLYGNIFSGGPYWNSNAAYVEVSSASARGAILPLTIDWTNSAGRLIGRATTRVLLDSTFVVVNNNRMQLGFAENGCLGYDDYMRGYYLGPGWHLSQNTNALFHGSFVLAADGFVSDNAYGNSQLDVMDWVSLDDSVAHFVPSSRSDIEAHATFEDRQAQNQLFAHVDAAALAWRAADRNNFMILEYRVTNRTSNAWQVAYAGLFLDIDLGSSESNIASFDTATGVVSVRQTAPSHPLVGIAPIAGNWGSLYIVNNAAEIDPVHWTDSTKWSLLREGIHSPPSYPMDLSLLTAQGPLSLAGHASQTFAFALVTGETVNELNAALQMAARLYVGATAPSVSAQQTGLQPHFFPNPLPAGADLKLVLPFAQTVNLCFFNILGQEVARFNSVRGGPEGIRLDRGSFRGASGLLFYRVEATNHVATGKLLLLR
jgi:serine protease